MAKIRKLEIKSHSALIYFQGNQEVVITHGTNREPWDVAPAFQYDENSVVNEEHAPSFIEDDILYIQKRPVVELNTEWAKPYHVTDYHFPFGRSTHDKPAIISELIVMDNFVLLELGDPKSEDVVKIFEMGTPKSKSFVTAKHQIDPDLWVGREVIDVSLYSIYCTSPSQLPHQLLEMTVRVDNKRFKTSFQRYLHPGQKDFRI